MWREISVQRSIYIPGCAVNSMINKRNIKELQSWYSVYICQNVYRRFAVLRILLALVLPTIEKKLGENSFS